MRLAASAEEIERLKKLELSLRSDLRAMEKVRDETAALLAVAEVTSRDLSIAYCHERAALAQQLQEAYTQLQQAEDVKSETQRELGYLRSFLSLADASDTGRVVTALKVCTSYVPQRIHLFTHPSGHQRVDRRSGLVVLPHIHTHCAHFAGAAFHLLELASSISPTAKLNLQEFESDDFSYLHPLLDHVYSPRIDVPEADAFLLPVLKLLINHAVSSLLELFHPSLRPAASKNFFSAWSRLAETGAPLRSDVAPSS